MGSGITRRHHFVKHDPLTFGRQHEHQATRLKGEAIDELTGKNGDAAVAVHLNQI